MITVRGSFGGKTGIKAPIKYELYSTSLVLGDPCLSVVYDIYKDPIYGVYYYSPDGLNFNICDGIFYDYAYFDYFTNYYYWNSYYISGKTFAAFGSAESQCGPV
jgi:hypothetical protein